MRFSVSNPITSDLLNPHIGNFCRGVFGFQSDEQSIGYDFLCPLATLMLPETNRCSYRAIQFAQKEIEASDYSRGFQEGWDGEEVSEQNEEYKVGHAHGKHYSEQCKWVGRRIRTRDMCLR